jgi:hypothetical protein
MKGAEKVISKVRVISTGWRSAPIENDSVRSMILTHGLEAFTRKVKLTPDSERVGRGRSRRKVSEA